MLGNNLKIEPADITCIRAPTIPNKQIAIVQLKSTVSPPTTTTAQPRVTVPTKALLILFTPVAIIPPSRPPITDKQQQLTVTIKDDPSLIYLTLKAITYEPTAINQVRTLNSYVD